MRLDSIKTCWFIWTINVLICSKTAEKHLQHIEAVLATCPIPWTTDCTVAFEKVKAVLAQAVTLAMPDFSKPFTIVTDASQVGIGGVLLQDNQPIAFESHKLSSAERNYSTTDREMFAVIYCLRKWRCYVHNGRPITVITDHKPNVSMESKTDLSDRQIR